MTTIEYALIAGLVAVTLLGVGVPVGQSLRATFGDVAAALDPGGGKGCEGLFCVEPAAGARPKSEPRRRP